MAKEIHPINLVSNKEQDLFTQFINWAFTIGRLLIILVELLALGTFLYRFALDMQILDLHDQIKQNSFIVQNFKNSEQIYRSLQNRLTEAKKYDNKNDTTLIIMQDIIEMGRGNVTFKALQVATESIDIEVQAASPQSLSQFVSALKSYPAIKTLSIDKVENKTASATITLAITARLTTATPTIQPEQSVNNQAVPK